MTVSEFVTIWLAWDERSGDHGRACAMEDACGRLAARCGLTTTETRVQLSALRRDGVDHREAVRQMLDSHRKEAT